MRIALVLSLGGCVASAGPVIAFGSQGAESVGLQLGAEGSVGWPIAEATVGGYWVQGHGPAIGGHLDLGWDSIFNQRDGMAGRLELGGLRFPTDEGLEFLGFEINAARITRQARCDQSGKALSLSISLRWIQSGGWAIALAPRAGATAQVCFGG